MSFLKELFATEQPVIGLIHMRALPGDPFYENEGMDYVISRARADLISLQEGGVDGVLFTNEFSMPYEKEVSPVTLAAMGMVIGALKKEIHVPFGAEAIFDGDASIALCAAVEADFTRCMFTGVWAGDLGLVDRDIAKTLRLKKAYGLNNLKLFYFVTSEGDACVGGRTTEDMTKSLLFNCRPDALVVGGTAAGAVPGMELLERVGALAQDTPVVCGTGCRLENVQEILSCCQGAFVGSTFKKDGKFENPVELSRVKSFMDAVKAWRGE
ncbi:BtpA/SgcQ family protein [Anaerotignum lactatifermentans]|uniref:BtpA/SgcQ family protein n=1 Tax=Anaerotignum lactatifermentans TaxID=160404 RepID=UPI002ED61765